MKVPVWYFACRFSILQCMDYDGTFICAYCGEENELFVEPEDGNEQQLTEDCLVCCRPNALTVRIVGHQIIIESSIEG